MPEQVILVNEHDQEIGTEEKLAAHQNGGKLHRAFSILVFNSQGEMLLQQRAVTKYHAGGLWTNTCCGHPRPGETLHAAVHRRLQEEMGFDCALTEKFSYIYKVVLDKDLTEHEYLHIFTGIWDGVPTINPDEAAAYRWISQKQLVAETTTNPEKFTPWFLLTLKNGQGNW